MGRRSQNKPMGGESDGVAGEVAANGTDKGAAEGKPCVIDLIAAVDKAAGECALDLGRISAMDGKSLCALREYFGVLEEDEVVCLAIAVRKSFSNLHDNVVRASELGPDGLLSLKLVPVVERLICKGYLIRKYRFADILMFYVNPIVMKGIIANVRPEVKSPSANSEKKDRFFFVKNVCRFLDEKYNMAWSYEEDACVHAISELNELEKTFAELKFVYDAVALIPDGIDRLIFYRVCDKFCNNEDVLLLPLISDLCSVLESRRKMDVMLRGDSALVKGGMIEFTRKGLASEARVTLGEAGKKIFLGDDIYLFERGYGSKDVVMPDAIQGKDLFYSDAVASQMNRFKSCISAENFAGIQKRLAERGMNCGFCVLFYGPPGTGKTESVFQIAKSCGRGVVKVDMSRTRDAWVGESEKNTRAIFSKYRECCKAVRNAGGEIPILLFNEADALFSKRVGLGNHNQSVNQMNNTMQNIILDEMEGFDGILIATTNMTENFDSAFERRFIYKVGFDAPSPADRRRIWSSRVEWLDDDALDRLLAFDFSGGQIENVAKKIVLHEILTGARPSVKEMEEFCLTERMTAGVAIRPIGFCA